MHEVKDIVRMLGKICAEISWISFFMMILVIVGMTSCSSLSDIAKELKVINQQGEKHE